MVHDSDGIHAGGHPAGAEAAAAAAGRPSARPRRRFQVEPLKGLRILLVEDDADLRTLLADFLATEGEAVVEEAEDGQVAWDRFHLHGPFDLVITDIQMPRMSGMGLLNLIRSQDPEVPVLLMTGYACIDRPKILGAFGSLEVLAKPFSLAGLCDTLARLVDGPSRALDETGS